jgi:hypothetical protein
VVLARRIAVLAFAKRLWSAASIPRKSASSRIGTEIMNWKKPKAQPKHHPLCIISDAKFSNNVGELRLRSPRSCLKRA